MKKNRISVKLAIIILMTLGLMIPAFLIQNLVEERARTSENSAEEIAGKWGGKQLLVTPVLSFSKANYDYLNTAKRIENSLILLYPENIQIHSEAFPFIKSYGIFKTVVYESDIKINGIFDLKKVRAMEYSNSNVNKNIAKILIRVSDINGLSEFPIVKIKGESYEFVCSKEINCDEVMTASIPMEKYLAESTDSLEFSLHFKVKGNRELLIAPTGLKNTAEYKSHWNTVSYIGNKLPNSHKEEKGIATAKWSTIGNQIRGNQIEEYADLSIFNNSSYSTIGASYIIAVDHYQLVLRSTKYALMFIVLTFSVFFFIEILSKKRIHPIQYLLVSIALLLFYTLLLSLSEQIGFPIAYLISAFAIVIMISLYSKSILKSGKHAGITAASLVVLYGFLYILLQLESYALIAGSIGLFVVLAVLMFVSRKIDWYGEEN